MAIIEHLRQQLWSDELRQRFRRSEHDFTRERVLSFARVVVLIVSGHKRSLQNALNKFFSVLGCVFEVPTASAYSQARQKLKPAVYQHLNAVVCEDFYRLYEAEGGVRRWRGYRVLAVDGTVLNVPDTPTLRAHFSVQRNQYPNSDCVQALASVLYDVGNDIGLSAGLGAKQAEKHFLFSCHGESLGRDALLVLDRAYADYSVLAWAMHMGCPVVIRFPRQSFAAVNAFWASDETQRTVRLEVTDKARALVQANGWPSSVSVRLLKVELEDDDVEVLGTTLLDSHAYPREEFKTVYGWRWGEETYFGRLKNIFELERFSGTSLTAIEQDFYGTVFLATLDSVLSKSAHEALNLPSPVATGSPEVAPEVVTAPIHIGSKKQVNRAVSYSALVERVSGLLAQPGCPPECILEELQHLLQMTPIRPRPGRHYPRPKLTPAKRLRFHRYVKRIIA